MPNRLLKYKNVAPLLEDELFVRALSLNSSKQYRDALSRDEKNRYAGFYPSGAYDALAPEAAGVLLLTTPPKAVGNEGRGTSANIVKLFAADYAPFAVIGVETVDDKVDLRNSVIEFGRYKNLEDAVMVAVAIHENDAFEIPDCLDEKPEILHPQRTQADKEERDRDYAAALIAEMDNLENRILDRVIWLQEARSNLSKIDPDSAGERGFMEILDHVNADPDALKDPQTAKDFDRLYLIHKLHSDVRLNDKSRKDDVRRLEETRRRHDAFVTRAFGPHVRDPDTFPRVI